MGRNPLSKRSPVSPTSVFWQTVLSVVVGVSAGVALLLYTAKPHAAAISNCLTPGQPPTACPDNAFTALFPNLSVLPALDRRTNVLVMGVDSNGPNTDRFSGTRSDTMIILSLDPILGKVGVLSLPRDTKVQIANGHGTNKLNAAHAFGGPELAIQTVRESLGIPVDHYIGIDTDGLKRLFEALGPVEVLVEKNMHYTDRTAHLFVDLQPGLQVLDPVQAEEYVRFRHDAMGDIGRIERQQWFLRQLAHKLKEPQVLLKLPQLVAFAHDYVETDLSLEDMAKLYSFLRGFDPQQVETAMLPGQPATISGCSYWLQDPAASQVVYSRLLGLAPALDATGISPDDPQQQQMLLSSTAGASGEDGQNGTAAPRPLSVSIKYPRGAEEAAARFEAALNDNGYQVRYKWAVSDAECQHEQIVENSSRADDRAAAGMRKALPDAANWPLVVAVDSHPVTDMTLVISPAVSRLTASVVTPIGGRHLVPSVED